MRSGRADGPLPLPPRGHSVHFVALETLSLPLDPRGFFRRQCPGCRREFKLRWTEFDGSLVLRHLGAAIQFANADELAQAAPLICPYCAHEEQAGSFFTPELQAHLAKRAQNLVAEIRFEQLRHVERSLSDNPYPTFLAIPPEPFGEEIAPEPDDMRVVLLPCCGEEIKLPEAWAEGIRCPYCASPCQV